MMPPDAVVITFDPHVQAALAMVMIAALVLVGIAVIDLVAGKK